MADKYVRSTDGSDADNGTTWALAKATLSAGLSACAAGDRLFVSQAHAEPSGSSLNSPGTLAAPVLVICGNDGAAPPTAVATSGVVTGGVNFSNTLYVYGLSFISSGFCYFQQGSSAVQRFESCKFETTNPGSGGGFYSGGNNSTYLTEFINCTFKWGHANNVTAMAGYTRIVGGGAAAGSATPNYCFGLFSDRSAADVDITAFDFSSLGSTVNIFGVGGGSGRLTVRDSKLPASWTGSLVTGTIPCKGQRFEMFNCDGADTNYRLWVEDYAGSVKQETTIVLTGGASDGTTPIAWKMTTSSSAKYPAIVLESPELAVWNDSVGAAVTATVEIVHDSQGAGSGAAFQDDEVWLELVHLGTSGFPLGARLTDCKADVLASAANQASSSSTWTTTGLTTPVKQKLSVTFTPQEKGFVLARVVLAKASKTVYVDPAMTVA